MSSSTTFANTKVLTLGASKNIGYWTALRLLAEGATVTFLLRKTSVFDHDETIQKYVKVGSARLIQGDGLVKEDVERAWVEAKKGSEDPVKYCIFTIGGAPGFKLSKGLVCTPANLCTQCSMNVLSTLPSPAPRLIAVSSAGVTKEGNKKVPFILKPMYALLVNVHHDKCGMEKAVAHVAGWGWSSSGPGEDIMGSNWENDLPAAGSYQDIIMLRPALLTDGESKATYRAVDGDIAGYTISRKDCAHFIVDQAIKNWDSWKGKIVGLAN